MAEAANMVRTYEINQAAKVYARNESAQSEAWARLG